MIQKSQNNLKENSDQKTQTVQVNDKENDQNEEAVHLTE